MSIIPLTVYLFTVSAILNLYVANGKPLFGKSGGKVHPSAPQAQFEALNEDWLKALEGEDFHEVETDDGPGGNSQSGVSPRTVATTPIALGFDFKYLFNKGRNNNNNNNNNNNKPSNNGGWGQTQTRSQKKKEQQNVNPNFQQNNGFDNQNQLGFGFNNQGPFQPNVPQFDPFNAPFQQAPSFLNFGRPGYSRSRRPGPIWGGHGYSRRGGFPLPPLFMGGFGGY